MADLRPRAARVVFGAMFFGFVALTGCGGGTPAKSPMSSDADGKGGPAEVGKPAPDLAVTTLNGKGKVTLESLQGKVAVIDFWATWCGPCKQSFPKLEELAKQNSGKLEVVGIAADDAVDGVADFAKANGATFPIAWDEGHSIASRWKVDSMPTSFVVDATGTVRYIHAGYHDGEAEKIAKEVQELASESKGKGAAKTEEKTEKKEEKAEKKEEKKEEAATEEDPPPKPAKKKPGKKGNGKKPPAKKKPAQ